MLLSADSSRACMLNVSLPHEHLSDINIVHIYK